VLHEAPSVASHGSIPLGALPACDPKIAEMEWMCRTQVVDNAKHKRLTNAKHERLTNAKHKYASLAGP
jgi:hypothetical protein